MDSKNYQVIYGKCSSITTGNCLNGYRSIGSLCVSETCGNYDITNGLCITCATGAYYPITGLLPPHQLRIGKILFGLNFRMCTNSLYLPIFQHPLIKLYPMQHRILSQQRCLLSKFQHSKLPQLQLRSKPLHPLRYWLPT